MFNLSPMLNDIFSPRRLASPEYFFSYYAYACHLPRLMILLTEASLPFLYDSYLSLMVQLFHEPLLIMLIYPFSDHLPAVN